MKIDYAKILTILLATFQAANAAAQDQVITVRDIFDIAEKVCDAIGIMDEPILDFSKNK